jgi:hypothetical protein
MFLVNLIEVDFQFTFIPNEFRISSYNLSPFEDWVSVFNMMHNNTIPPKISFENSSQIKCHLLLLLPLATRLATCKWIAIQKTALEIMRFCIHLLQFFVKHFIYSILDMSTFIASYHEAMTKLDYFTHENQILLTEINRLKNQLR